MAPKLGLIVPDDGPLDYELYRLEPWLLQVGVEVEIALEHSVTPGVEVGADSPRLESCLKKTGSDEVLHPCARKLAEVDCDAIVWACTSGSFVGGHRWAREQAKRIRRVSDLPTSSTTLAIIEALAALNCPQIDLLSTYPHFVTRRLIETLDEADIEVVETVNLQCAADDGFAVYANFVIELDLMQAVASFKDNTKSTRPILIPNTSMNTLGLVEQMEHIAGRSVVTANQASLWHGLRMVRSTRAPQGAGSLFEVTTARTMNA